jgi:hypothetical protein
MVESSANTIREEIPYGAKVIADQFVQPVALVLLMGSWWRARRPSSR